MYEGTDLDKDFLDMVDRLKVPAVADILGVGTSTIFTQASKIREERGSLSGNAHTQFIKYLRAQTSAEDGAEPGLSETAARRPESRSAEAPDEPIEEAWTSDWEEADLTGERRRLREIFDTPNHITDGGTTPGQRVPPGADSRRRTGASI